jgi:hypothetical protein
MVDVLGSPTLGNKFASRVAGNLMLTSAAACAAGICSASVVFGMDIVTKASEQASQNSPVMQSSQSTEQQSSVFGDWGRVAQLAK